MRMTLILALAGLPLASAAKGIAAEDLAYVAMCEALFGDADLKQAAFSDYAERNPDGLSDSDMAEIQAMADADVETDDIKASPAALLMMEGVCDSYRDALLPG